MNKRIKKKNEKNQIKKLDALDNSLDVVSDIDLAEQEEAKEDDLQLAEENDAIIPAEAADVEEITTFSIQEDIKVKKHHKRAQNCILFAMLAISVIGMTIYGFVVSWYGDYLFSVSLDRPVFMSVIMGEMDEVEETVTEEESSEEASYTESEEDVTETETEFEESEEETEEEPEISPKLMQEFMDYYGEVPYTIGDDELTHYVGWNDTKSGSRYYTNPGVRAVSTIYDYKQVDQSYFDNALIIGDSRIEGLHAYSGWENATFLYKRGLTVYAMMDKEVNLNNGARSTAVAMLGQRQFDNIYIMVGVNELGGGTDEAFAEKYQENIERIRELQPDARIIIMSIMFETKEYSDSKPVYNNDNINAKNVAIAKLANGEDIFYLDVNPSIASPETGVMPEEYSFDGVHMKAQYYSYWVDYMYAHGY